MSGNNIYNTNIGNVGIGTTSPTQRLDVSGKIRMRARTESTDSSDIVATKGYVDDSISNILFTQGWVAIDTFDPTHPVTQVLDRGNLLITHDPSTGFQYQGVQYNAGGASTTIRCNSIDWSTTNNRWQATPDCLSGTYITSRINTVYAIGSP